MLTIKKMIALITTAIIGLCFFLFSFTEKKEEATLKYRYRYDTEALISDPDNWDDVSDEENPQGCMESETFPCLVEFTSTEYADIDAFLAQHSNSPSILSSGKVTSFKQEGL